MAEPSIVEELGGDSEKVGNIKPPGETRGRPRKTTSRSKITLEEARELQKGLEKFFREVVAPVVSIADEYDAQVIDGKAKQLATAYAALARENVRFYKMLNALMVSGGPTAGAIFVSATVAIPILHHHKIISVPTQLGIPLGVGLLEEHPEEEKPEKKEGETSDNGNAGDARDSAPSLV